jgi:hypothetical protein
MSDEIRINRPASSPRPEQYSTGAEVKETAPAKSSKVPWIVLAVAVVVLVVVGVLFRDKLFGGAAKNAATNGSSGYQAVFLTNGQVYFGKISNTAKDYVTLKDIYYLQVGPQQGSGAATTTSAQSISLVKLGNELHGPVDEMHISRPQILFYEDLKSDGQVVKAIIQDQSTKK